MDRSPAALYHHVEQDITTYLARKEIDHGVSIVKDPAYPISGYTDVGWAASANMLRSIIKKFEPDAPLQSLRDKAVNGFLSSNLKCKRWERTDDPLCSYVIDEMAYIASRELHSIEWSTMLSRVRSGPGASVSSRGRNSFLEKFFINPLTTTNPALYSEFRAFMLQKSSWWAAEYKRILINANSAISVVHGSHLSTVPKNDSTDRTICTEPSLNMFFQLALGDEFNRVLARSYGYDPAIQPDRNRRSARIGSVDGSVATIDLRSASDTISLKLCEYVLPSDWFAAISDCRSPYTLIDGRWCRLEMVSSMGNGFTFPLQTYLFSLAIKALCRVLDFKFERYSDSHEFGVFGDDIIVPTRLYEPMLKLLTSLGFTPNVDKSFSEGSFRESCGTDWFQGVNIRGVYIRRLRTDADLYSAVNRLNRWSALHGIPLPRTIQYLLPRSWRSFRVPYDEDDTSGVKTAQARLTPGGYVYKALKPRIRLVSIFRKEVLKSQFDNAFGVILAASIGALRSDGVSRRQGNTVSFPVRLRTPFWVNIALLRRDGLTFREWEDTLYINLPLM